MSEQPSGDEVWTEIQGAAMTTSEANETQSAHFIAADFEDFRDGLPHLLISTVRAACHTLDDGHLQ
jgi:hypothetical protein